MMKPNANIYPARERATNVELIKGLLYAESRESYDGALTRFIENIHPSLFAELDWMENSVPAQRRENAQAMNDALFLNNLESIIKLREIEFELPQDELFDEIKENRDFYKYILETEPKISKVFKENNYRAIVSAYEQTNEKSTYANPNKYKEIARITEHKLYQINDRQNLPLVMREVLMNLLALSLDHVSTRMRTKKFVRKTGMEVFQFNVGEITSEHQIMELKDMVSYIKENVHGYGLLPLWESLSVMEDFLDHGNILKADRFDGEKAVGYGHCGHCAMMFCSAAVISLDSTCPYFIDQNDRLHLPLEFNSAQCPFCGKVRRIDTPAMFYRPSNKKVIYNIPTQNQYSESEAEDLYGEMIGKLRERYKKRISAEEAEVFDRSGEEITYNMVHFITAIQMGTVNRVWHTFLRLRLADGSALLLDQTSNTLIDLIYPADVTQMWDLIPEDTAGKILTLDKNIDKQAFRDAKEVYNRGDYQKAETLFANLYKTHPEDKIIGRYLASVYMYLGKNEMAVAIFNTN